jgi:tripartite-type tricarboxylate transporter receptor subunit TctC
MSLADAGSLSPGNGHRQHADMLLVPGGTFRMGSDKHYPEEAPVHRVTAGGFWMDRTPVTNRLLREFVEATGYITFAEIAPDPKDYPGALPHMLTAGSLVFSPPNHPIHLGNIANWRGQSRRHRDSEKERTMASRQPIGTGITAALGSALFFLLGAAASAQEAGNYPNKQVMMIVPFAPGGASDFVARIIQPGVSQILGQQIVIDNRLGAAGIVGTEAAARAAPDGYTAFLGNVGTISINPAVSNMRIKPDKDLAPVSICADTPSILITRPDFPANTVSELVAYVKASQGKVTFASPGSSTLNRLEMEVFKKDAGLDMVHVPYKGGAAPAVTDVLGGHVDLMFTTISSAMELVKEKKVKALAVTTKERMVDLPDIPTMYELGWKNLVTSSWQGVLVPTGTPRSIIEKLRAAIVKVLAEPTIQARMRSSGVIAVASKSPEDFQGYMDAETAKWTKVIEENGLHPD